MDTAAHRLLRTAHRTLLDLGYGEADERQARGLTDDQHQDVGQALTIIERLIGNDPEPPACPNCCTPLTQPATGRPRRFCSDACRQQEARSAR